MTQATKEKSQDKVTHNFTEVVNKAIEEHGSKLLKHLSKDEPFVQDFAYRPGEGFIKVGKVFIGNRPRSCYRKGIMRLSGEVKQHLESLPKALKTELLAKATDILFDQLDVGGSQSAILLQVFNKAVQEDINQAVEKAGHEPFLFEQDYVNGAGIDSKVFVMMYYDGWMPDEDRLEEIRENNEGRKRERLAKLASAETEDVRTGSAEYAVG